MEVREKSPELNESYHMPHINDSVSEKEDNEEKDLNEDEGVEGVEDNEDK